MRNRLRHTRVWVALLALAVLSWPGSTRARAPPTTPPPDAPAKPDSPVGPAQQKEAALLAAARARLEADEPEAVVEALAPLEEKLAPDALLLLTTALQRSGRSDAEAVLQRAVARFPTDLGLRGAWVDAALAKGRCATALQRVGSAGARLRETPELQLRAAQAYFHLGAVLGDAQVRTVRGGRAGQFVGDWLLVERRPGPDRFLCCPCESALHPLRQALDAGLDVPPAHVLHARIWQRIGRPQIGLTVLKSRATVLLAHPEEGVLEAFSDLALDAGALADYLRYERLRADRQPQRRAAILFAACLTAAERYNQRGEEALYIQWLHRARQARPDNVEVLLRLADAEWAAGRFESASPVYRRLLQLEPGHPQRGRILGRLTAAPPPDR